MKQYNVTGMSCAACQARVEKAVRAVPGVQECAVSLLTNSMGVEGTAEPEAVIAAVCAAGYGASLKGREKSTGSAAEALEDHETPKLVRRLCWSLAFLAALMYLSMGHMMWGWPVPEFLRGNHVAMGMAELLLAGIVMVINQRFFISGTKSLLSGAPNMDTLVSMGSAAAFGYSTCALFAMSAAQLRGGEAAAAEYMNELYFESAAMILTLITVGKMLEARSKGRTTDALRGLMKLAPTTATVVRGEEEVTVDASDVRPGDIFLVRPGESIPVDGTVLEGASAVNEAALTGESIPADKAAGDHVSAATVNQSGFLKCRADRVGKDTTLEQIIRMVEEAAATKAPIAKIADRVSGIFVPAVIGIAAVTTAVWLILGRGTGFALARGISVLVISCPCALGLATPVAIMVGSGVGAKNGILFKTAAALEETGRVQIVALDKTGTITSGEPRVTDVRTAPDVTEEELVRLAAQLERRSEHPLAGAVLRYAQERGLAAPADISDFEAFPGNGLSGRTDGHLLCAGNERFIEQRAQLPEKLRQEAQVLAGQGKTPMYFARDGRTLGLIAAADVLREDSVQAVKELRSMGLEVVMLTGDRERTAKAIGAMAGVDHVIAGVLPDGKESVIRALQRSGRVAMVGDGINDAPALTRADVGIAIGAGTDVAIDSADVVLMKSRASDIPAAIRLSRAVLRSIHQNLFWAFFYNAIGIPLAAGVFIPAGLTLNPMFGAAAMSLSSFCVVTNALRLNLFRLRDPSHDRKRRNPVRIPDDIIQNQKENTSMKKTMKIEGMMCPHCEAAVKTALEALPFVESAEVSHKTGTAVLTLKAAASDEELRKAVTDKGYKVLSIG